MTKERKGMLAAGGWLLMCMIVSWAAFNHATRDLSHLERPGPVVGKWARFEKALYGIAGRPGLVVLDLGFLAVGIFAFASSLKRAGVRQSPTVQVSDAARAKANASAERRTCACCNSSVPGAPTELPDGGAALQEAVGYLCRSCGALFCVDCAEKRIGWSRWDGWGRRKCPVCGGRFAPDTALVKS